MTYLPARGFAVAALVAFLSDFGTKDYYVAAVKASMKIICPDVEIIDISHEVPPWSLLTGCYILSCCFDDFPPETVFLAVVDPGVGTRRRPLVVRSKRYWFVGPDNGLLTCTAEKDPPLNAWVIENPPTSRKKSHTFHGRDIFGPVAALLACGGNPWEIGREYAELSRLSIWEPVVMEGAVVGRVVHIDRFGNAALNIRREFLDAHFGGLEERITLEIPKGSAEVPFKRTYGEVERGEPLALINSCGFLELAVNQGSAADLFGLAIGDTVVIRLGSRNRSPLPRF